LAATTHLSSGKLCRFYFRFEKLLFCKTLSNWIDKIEIKNELITKIFSQLFLNKK